MARNVFSLQQRSEPPPPIPPVGYAARPTFTLPPPTFVPAQRPMYPDGPSYGASAVPPVAPPRQTRFGPQFPAPPVQQLPQVVQPAGSVFPDGYSTRSPPRGLDFVAIAHMNPGEEMLRYVQVMKLSAFVCSHCPQKPFRLLIISLRQG